MSRGKLIVMSAVSGAGKTTLQGRVLKKFPNLQYSVSATTRAPRPGEIDGVHYHFLTVPEFKKMIEEDGLVEWMQVHNNFYGTPKKFLEEKLEEGKDLLLDLDVFGKLNFDKIYPEGIGIFVTVPDMETLEKRLRARGTNTEEDLRLRLKNAAEELSTAKSKGKYEHWLVNDDLDRADAELTRIIAEATGREPAAL